MKPSQTLILSAALIQNTLMVKRLRLPCLPTMNLSIERRSSSSQDLEKVTQYYIKQNEAQLLLLNSMRTAPIALPLSLKTPPPKNPLNPQALRGQKSNP